MLSGRGFKNKQNSKALLAWNALIWWWMCFWYQQEIISVFWWVGKLKIVGEWAIEKRDSNFGTVESVMFMSVVECTCTLRFKNFSNGVYHNKKETVQIVYMSRPITSSAFCLLAEHTAQVAVSWTAPVISFWVRRGKKKEVECEREKKRGYSGGKGLSGCWNEWRDHRSREFFQVFRN